MAGPREASTAPSVRTPRSPSSRSTAVPGHESPSLLSSKATELAFPCYRWYVSRRRKALQIATGTSRTCSNAINELMPAALLVAHAGAPEIIRDAKWCHSLESLAASSPRSSGCVKRHCACGSVDGDDLAGQQSVGGVTGADDSGDSVLARY